MPPRHQPSSRTLGTCSVCRTSIRMQPRVLFLPTGTQFVSEVSWTYIFQRTVFSLEIYSTSMPGRRVQFSLGYLGYCEIACVPSERLNPSPTGRMLPMMTQNTKPHYDLSHSPCHVAPTPPLRTETTSVLMCRLSHKVQSEQTSYKEYIDAVSSEHTSDMIQVEKLQF